MEIEVLTTKREELVRITRVIEKEINIEEGLVNIFVPHATAGVTINENADPQLPVDITDFLNKLVKKGIWKHDRIDSNADSHIKASLIGNSVLVPVINRKMGLGTWQDIFLCEFDGPRKRRVVLSFIENEKRK